MKTLPAIAAFAIAMALVMSPMVVNAAAGSITFTSPASGASYSGSQGYTISGTISPVPTQADQVGITVKNPSGQTVDLASVSVSSGSFSYATAVGGSSEWVSGTYTITALDSNGATATTTFSYTCTSCGLAGSTVYQKDVLGNLSQILQNQQTIMSDLGTLTSTVNGINTAVGTLSTNVGTILSDINSLTSTVGQINTNVGTLSSQLPSAGTISNTQTYVLVVAVLAAITLVLELAILVRKLS